MKNVYTSKDIEVLDCEDIADLSSSYELMHYIMTPSELEWMLFIKNRYSIYDALCHVDFETGLVSIDFLECSQAMDEDNRGMGKAVCLSDDTSLQKILFSVYSETEVDE
jgi:hypothetical protein